MELPKGFPEENFSENHPDSFIRPFQVRCEVKYTIYWKNSLPSWNFTFCFGTLSPLVSVFFQTKKMALINPLHASYKALKRRAAKLKM